MHRHSAVHPAGGCCVLLFTCGVLVCVWMCGVWGWQPPPAASRPAVKWEPNDLPFMSKTTAGEAYVGGPIEPRRPYAPPSKAKLR